MSTTVQTRQVSEGGVTRSVASQSDARFGNTRKVTADGQAVSGTFVYDAFGTLTYSSGDPGLRNRYCGNWGYRDDGDAGLLHVGARYYDPTTGRFTTRDTLLTEHPYVYCDGDPANAVDPDGREQTNWQEVWHVGVTGLGALVGATIGAYVGAAVGSSIGGSVGGPPGAAAGAVIGGRNGAAGGAVLGGMLGELAWQHRQRILEIIREFNRLRRWQYPTSPFMLPLKYR